MIEPMKNENEYRDDGRLYIKRMKRCVCSERLKESYRLLCRIIQRGEHYYTYNPEDDFISKVMGEKKLWLCDDSKETIDKAVELFKENVRRIKSINISPIVIPGGNMKAIYERKSWDTYNGLIIESLPDGQSKETYYENKDLHGMIFDIVTSLNYEYRAVSDILIKSDSKTLKLNPIYQAAVKNKDEILKIRLKLYYNLATDNDCKWISGFLGTKILPILPVEYNRNYVIDGSSAKYSDIRLLENSGYKILHRPYFAMMGSTHTRFQINPHTKVGVDAAKIDEEAISFREFLSLFEGKAEQ